MTLIAKGFIVALSIMFLEQLGSLIFEHILHVQQPADCTRRCAGLKSAWKSAMQLPGKLVK